MGAAMSAINDAVAVYLSRSGKTKAQFADELGIDRNTLRKKLSGSADLKLSEIERICSITGIEMSDVFDGRE